MVAVPVLAPLPSGWVILAFAVDDMLARDLRQLTTLDVSFLLAEKSGRWRRLGSTLQDDSAADLIANLPLTAQPLTATQLQTREGLYQVRLVPLSQTGDAKVMAVLQRSYAKALGPFARLRTTLLALALVSLLVSIAASFFIALGITHPLSALVNAALRIRRGDYASPVTVASVDEIGVLASSLNHMREGIAQREEAILRLAYQDSLTELPNRSKFNELLRVAIENARRRDKPLSILVMDLDRFKYVNDTLGHGVGDHVLCEVARRLMQLLGTEDCVARLGGDEFALLLPVSDEAQIIDISRRIVASLEQPILYEEQPLDVGASIGIAYFPAHGADAMTLVRNADIAMYVAKRNKTGYAIYDPHYDATQQEHLSLLGELRRAVEHNELRLYYQPKVSLSHSSVSAVEALLRWSHPTRGVVPPALFIPFAEHTGYIKVLTRWVLEEAIRQCGEWRRDGLQLRVAVNVSARDLMNRDLPDLVASLLQRHDVPASLLCIEITESGFMEDPAHAQKVLDRLAALGLQLSIDDYGTGYSSLSYIMKLPVNELKIDRSFVSTMVGNRDVSTIVRSTIELGHSLGLKVAAEGVENAADWEMLQRLGCDQAQGYFMSPPLPPEKLTEWLRTSKFAMPEPLEAEQMDQMLGGEARRA
jgi:diguanylate cyclase (GGDEF)-like protein